MPYSNLDVGGITRALITRILTTNKDAPSRIEIIGASAVMGLLAAQTNDLVNDTPVSPTTHANRQGAFKPVLRLMRNADWEFSGSGYFSAVFIKHGLAIKVGFKLNDSARDYAQWCQENKGMAGVPVVYSVSTYANCYVVLMDRCEDLAGELDEASALYDPHIAAEFDAVRTVLQGGEADGFETCDTARNIREDFKEAEFDMHSGNAMIDRKGNLVITDPVSYRESRGGWGDEQVATYRTH